ncbi:nucleotidyltransferase domain-containing protein [Halobacillus campisalis]|uniref:Nucleotidyltransferase domain-containing protein n=1 Tax=Halobacillus campisalis TaxID=435909 RepID=A0ABW2K7R1_9BACI|nr:hypothetical protein [Halobacillus campisalis]
MFETCMNAKEFMEGFKGKWMVAGGWAIDLHIGEETREHEAIEIAVFHEDLQKLSEHLQGWKTYITEDAQLVEWDLSQPFDSRIHEIHARHEEEQLEILLNFRDKNKWKFRRDEQITFPLDHMNLHSAQGIPYLNPEIVLLHKSKNTREKDDNDFNYVFPFLNERQKEWLKQALIQHEPTHPWLEKLLY